MENKKWIHEVLDDQVQSEGFNIELDSEGEDQLQTATGTQGTFNSVQAWAKIKGRLNNTAQTNNRVVTLPLGLLKYAAVIAIPLMIGTVVYLSTNKQVSANKQQQVVVKPAKKETNKVILILENGDQVNLNAQQDLRLGNKVISENSQLDYSQTEQTAQTAKFNTLIVPKGTDYKLLLNDSTQVWVNADSRIKYQVNFAATQTRLVYLEKGEAYFKVTKNPAKPFIVHHGDMVVEVKGTSFNVNAYADNVQTTLVEGKVNIEGGNKQLILTPGQQASFDKASGALEKQEVDVFPFVAWKQGVIVFQNMNMELLMEKIGRLYDYDIEFKDDSLKRLHYTGRADRTESIQNILNNIQITAKLKFTIKERSIIVEKST
ncbi:FecR domain-containing protein [Solitalea sp. MAHUQ-68]|uniref:FecR domain-containing protein n=1 Tax=Solitalea agri TaxID=2953739 RepID=A0A9X2EZG3_9SPHI|nr:FecR domain-containing protein [Solitalea agri]MCO4291884.1 FecR domain-containing protein [Solitalea agri]